MMKRIISVFCVLAIMCATIFCGAISVSAADSSVTVSTMSELAAAISNARHNGGPKTIYLNAGTYTATANAQLELINVDGMSLIGNGDVIIDTGAYVSNSMAGMCIMSNNVTIQNVTIRNSDAATLPCIKIAGYDTGTAFNVYSNITLSGVTVENYSAAVSAVIVHGAANVNISGTVKNMNDADDNQYYAIGIASSSNVNVENAYIYCESATAPHIGFNYANKGSQYQYQYVASSLNIDANVTYGNGADKTYGVIFSERPVSGTADVVTVNGTELTYTDQGKKVAYDNGNGWYTYDSNDWDSFLQLKFYDGYVYTNGVLTSSEIDSLIP